VSDQPPQGWYQPGPPSPQNGLGTAAMVLGIISLVLFWTIIVGVICGALAVIFGAIGRGRAKRGEATNRGSATAGLVTGIIAILASVVFIAALVPRGCFYVGTGTSPCTNR
jgi:uncharacterized membrane protein